MAQNNVNLGITIHADGSTQVANELNHVESAINRAGTAATSTGRHFSELAAQTSQAAAATQRANAIYADNIARLTMTREAYAANSLTLQGLTAAQVQHISALEAQSAAQASATATAAKWGAGLGTLAVLIATVVIRNTLHLTETLQNLEIRMRSLTNGSDDYAAATEYLNEVSNRHHKDLLTMTDSFSRLLTTEQTGIITRKQSIAILEGLSNAQSRTGATSAQLDQAMVGMNQALNMGTVQWEELKQVTEPIPGLMTKIANAAGYMGESAIGDFKNVTSASQVTSKMLGQILVEAFKSYQGAAEEAGDTLTAKYADIQNAWTNLVKVVESPISDAVTPVLHVMAIAIEDFGLAIDSVMNKWNAFNSIATADNGQNIDLTGRAKPPGYIEPTTKNKAATSEATEIRKQIEANAGSKTKAAAAHHAAAKVHSAASKAISDAAREEAQAIKSLQNAYENQVESLLKAQAAQADGSAAAAMEYDVTKGSLKNLTEEKKLYLLQLTGEIQNAKLTTDSNKAQEEELKSLKDKYDQLTLSASDYYAKKLANQGMNPTQAAPLIAQNNVNIAVGEKQDKIKQDADALKAYADSLSQATLNTAALGSVSSSVFDSALGGINAMAGAFSTMVTSIQANTEALAQNAKMQALNEANPKAIDYQKNRIKFEGEAAKLEKKNVSDSLGGMAQMAGAAAKMFNQKSSAAKAFNTLSQTLAAAQLAMNLVTMASNLKSTITGIAAGAAQMFAQSGWAGFAGVAAMLAVMGTLGFAAGGSSSGKEPKDMTPEQKAATAGGGTTLGDPLKLSESINNSMDALKEINASSYRELRGINTGIKNLADAIKQTITNLFKAGGLTSVDLNQKNVNTIATGIWTDPIAFGDVLAGALVRARQADVIQTGHGGGIFGGKKTYTYQLQLSQLNDDITKGINDIFQNMGKVMLDLSRELGGNLEEKLRAFIIPSISLDLKGLSAEDAAKKLNNVISAALDRMADSVFGEMIGQYQQLGEGMLQTAIRIVSEVAIVKSAFELTGSTMGEDALKISDGIVQLAGGLQAFQDSFGTYYDKFYSDQEKFTQMNKQLGDELKDNNLVLPKTREGYRKLLESIDMTNEANIKQYALLIQLADAADKYYTAQAALKKTQQDQEIALLEAQGNAAAALAAKRRIELAAMDESLRHNQKIIYATQDLAAAYQVAENALNGIKSQFEAIAKSIHDFRLSLMVGGLSPNSKNEQYALTKAILNENLRIVNLGLGHTEASRKRYADALATLQNNSTNFLNASMEHSRSAFEYARDFAKAQRALLKGEKGATKVVTDAEKQLAELQASVKGLIKINTSILSVEDAVKKVKDEIKKLVFLQEHPPVKPPPSHDIKPPKPKPPPPPAPPPKPQGDETYAWIAMWQQRIAALRNGILPANIWQALYNQEDDLSQLHVRILFNGGTLQGYKNGGDHPGGYRIVGENGPELESTGASRIFNASQTRAILAGESAETNKELLNEIRALKAEVKYLREDVKNGEVANVVATKEQTKLFKTWDVDGLPATRT